MTRVRESVGKSQTKKDEEGVGREWREGRRWALVAVLTLGSFLPNLSPALAGQAGTVRRNS